MGQMKCNKDTTYGAAAVRGYIEILKLSHEFDTDTEEGKIVTIKKKMEQKGVINKAIKNLSQEFEDKAVEKIINLTDKEVDNMLIKKWIHPVIAHIDEDVKQVMMKLVNGLEELKEKYKYPMPEIDEEINKVNSDLCAMLDELCGSSVDMEAIDIFRKGLL